MRPLGRRLIVEPLALHPNSVGKIVLPANYNDGASVGQFRVLAVGPRVTDLAPGDRCLIDLQGDHTILEDGTRIVRDRQVILSWT